MYLLCANLLEGVLTVVPIVEAENIIVKSTNW